MFEFFHVVQRSRSILVKGWHFNNRLRPGIFSGHMGPLFGAFFPIELGAELQ